MCAAEQNRDSVGTQTAKESSGSGPWSSGGSCAAGASFAEGHIQWSPVLSVAGIERCAVHRKKFNNGVH